MTNAVPQRVQTGPLRRYLMLALIALGGYLCQVCVMPYVVILDVTPNLLMALIGIVTVAYGKLRAFWLGMFYGLLMEIMCPSVPMLNLAIYSLSTLFCSFGFADKPLKTIEYERATNRQRKELPPWLRSLLCAMLNTAVVETIRVTYIYLGGTPLTPAHFLRAALDVVWTGGLTLILTVPLRRAIFGARFGAPELKASRVEFAKK